MPLHSAIGVDSSCWTCLSQGLRLQTSQCRMFPDIIMSNKFWKLWPSKARANMKLFENFCSLVLPSPCEGAADERLERRLRRAAKSVGLQELANKSADATGDCLPHAL
ncbi:uncharacterized protein LOC109833131 [Asparagus officinalis]|uniref:uncharacterized protein LOC109833131 n=1 Tax=Asparagus officinalis TaxID=4686 RepID=UPI00098DF059|nr:uncharacterized protein LOC109833131 [Asparagus officinalis]